jgi:hypothetical protein
MMEEENKAKRGIKRRASDAPDPTSSGRRPLQVAWWPFGKVQPDMYSIVPLNPLDIVRGQQLDVLIDVGEDTKRWMTGAITAIHRAEQWKDGVLVIYISSTNVPHGVARKRTYKFNSRELAPLAVYSIFPEFRGKEYLKAPGEQIEQKTSAPGAAKSMVERKESKKHDSRGGGGGGERSSSSLQQSPSESMLIDVQPSLQLQPEEGLSSMQTSSDKKDEGIGSTRMQTSGGSNTSQQSSKDLLYPAIRKGRPWKRIFPDGSRISVVAPYTFDIACPDQDQPKTKALLDELCAKSFLSFQDA